MLNQLMNDGDQFRQHMLQRHAENNSTIGTATDLSQWLQYWDDAESVTSNLRKLEHWLQRARMQRS